MASSLAKTLTVVSLCSPGVLGLRGSHMLRKDSEKKQDDLPKDPRAAAPSTKVDRTLQNDEDCARIDSLPSLIMNHPLTSVYCSDPNTCGGCCRIYTWLFCDNNNAFPDIPCICKGNTEGLLNFEDADEEDTEDDKEQVPLPTQPPVLPTQAPVLPTQAPTAAETPPEFIMAFTPQPTAVQNSTNVTDTANGTVIATVVTEDEGYFAIQEAAAAPSAIPSPTSSPTLSPVTSRPTEPPTPKPTTSSPITSPPTSAMPTNAPTPKPTISPDACMTGSPYDNLLGFDAFFECQTSLDCAGLVPAVTISRANGLTDGHGGELVARSQLVESRKGGGKSNKKDDDDEDEDDQGEDDQGDGTPEVLSAQEEPEPVFCCLASMCLCGSPLGNWEGLCVPPYTIPEQVANATDAPSAAGITNPPSMRPTPLPPTTSAPTSNPPSTRAPIPVTEAPVEPPSQAPAPVTEAPVETPSKAPVEPPSQAPVPNPTTAVPAETSPVPVTNQTNSPVTAAPLSLTAPPSNVTSNATTMESFPAPPTASNMDAPQPTATTECSEGSFYHDNPAFMDNDFYRVCVTNDDCDQEKVECCLLEFCFCGTVSNGDTSACVRDV